MATLEVVVIGGGIAGVAAAVEAARSGAAVTLVAEDPIGGRGTHASLVPSKVLLHFVKETKARGGPKGAVDLAPFRNDADEVARREGERLRSRLDDAGVGVIRGTARFASSDTVAITREGGLDRTIRWDRAIVATGSVPSFPPGFLDGGTMDGVRVFAPRHLRTLASLPKSLLVVGGGATGAEVAYAMNALGVEVTWMLDELGILPDFDRELTDSLGDVLMERGVKLVHGKRVIRVSAPADGDVLAQLDGGRTYSSERAFVAVGRTPDLSRLGLGAVGLAAAVEDGRLPVDRRMRSANPNVFAAGDPTGRPYVANKAALEGWIAGRGAVGVEVPEIDVQHHVEAVYAEPEIAVVGVTPGRAAEARRQIDVRTISFDESVRGWLSGVGIEAHARGTLRLVADASTGVVIGATAIGPNAAEVLGPIALAVRMGATLEQLATSSPASPSFGELAARAGR